MARVFYTRPTTVATQSTTYACVYMGERERLAADGFLVTDSLVSGKITAIARITALCCCSPLVAVCVACVLSYRAK